MTAPLEIEDGQQPYVHMEITFKRGKWSACISFDRNQCSAEILNIKSFEDGISKIREQLSKHGIK